MSLEQEIERGFEKLLGRKVDTFAATVLEVDKNNGTCKVEDDEIEYVNVRLSSVVNSDTQKVYLFPKVGSSVLVSPIHEDINQLYVDKISEVESIAGIIGESVFEIDTNGFRIERQGVNVKEILKNGFENQNRLNAELRKVVVAIGVTPNVATLTQIKEDNEQVITDLQKVFK